jgi:hypothetical protein
LTGKQKYRQQIEKELDPSNPGLQIPQRTKRAESLLAAMPFIINQQTWNMVNPIHNIAYGAVPVVSEDDAKLAVEVISSSSSAMARRIAARIAFEGRTFVRESSGQEAKAHVVRRFRSATNPLEQAYLAKLIGSMASDNSEKKALANVLAERLEHLGSAGAKDALQALTFIGDKDHLPIVRMVKADSRYPTVREAAAQAEVALQRNLIKYQDAETRVAEIIDSMNGVKSLSGLFVGIGEIRSMKKIYGIHLRTEQTTAIKSTYRRLKSR